MPITPFQREILTLLKNSRNPESYVAGGTAIQRSADSIRYSNDIDFFHDTEEAVTTAFNSDRKTLLENKYHLEQLLTQPSFYRAIVKKGKDSVRLEWVRDTAFRFFPVIEDKDLGFRLHDIDLAINKCLALANRTEIRDVIDIIDINAKIIPLAACIWAACGKDPGFTPDLIIEMVQRHVVITPDLLAAESLVRPIDPKALKIQVQNAIGEAKTTIASLDPKEIGCVYLDSKGVALRKLERLNRKGVIRHLGSVKGAWPRLIER